MSKPIRSPSYPSISLKNSVEAIGKIEKQYRQSAVDREVAAKVIGYSSLSGPANKALAALAAYGLLERAGKGEARVTDRAVAILYAENEKEKTENLMAAAFNPPLFDKISERFPGLTVPPEDGVVTYLNRQGFNPNAVKRATRAFLSTMQYIESLGASDSHGKGVDNGSEFPSESDTNTGGAKVGDLVQWEMEGNLQLAEAARVRAVQTHDGKEWVFVDGSETGLPMEQVIVEKQGPDQEAMQPPRLGLEVGAQKKEGWEEERLIDDGGDEIFISYEGKPTIKRYEFIRDYLDFKLDRLKKAKAS